MKHIVDKVAAGKVVIRRHPDDVSPRVQGLAAKLVESEHATLTPRERDLLLMRIAQQLDSLLRR